MLLAAQPHPVFVGTGCVTTPGVPRHPGVERTGCGAGLDTGCDAGLDTGCGAVTIEMLPNTHTYTYYGSPGCVDT